MVMFIATFTAFALLALYVQGRNKDVGPAGDSLREIVECNRFYQKPFHADLLTLGTVRGRSVRRQSTYPLLTSQADLRFANQCGRFKPIQIRHLNIH